MSENNFERMIALAESTFDAHNDKRQLDIDEEIMEQLFAIHPASVSEYTEGNGPLIWVLLIPTTDENMKLFLESTFKFYICV